MQLKSKDLEMQVENMLRVTGDYDTQKLRRESNIITDVDANIWRVM